LQLGASAQTLQSPAIDEMLGNNSPTVKLSRGPKRPGYSRHYKP